MRGVTGDVCQCPRPHLPWPHLSGRSCRGRERPWRGRAAASGRLRGYRPAPWSGHCNLREEDEGSNIDNQLGLTSELGDQAVKFATLYNVRDLSQTVESNWIKIISHSSTRKTKSDEKYLCWSKTHQGTRVFFCTVSIIQK